MQQPGERLGLPRFAVYQENPPQRGRQGLDPMYQFVLVGVADEFVQAGNLGRDRLFVGQLVQQKHQFPGPPHRPAVRFTTSRSLLMTWPTSLCKRPFGYFGDRLHNLEIPSGRYTALLDAHTISAYRRFSLEVTARDLQRLYARLPDEELLLLNRDDLTDLAVPVTTPSCNGADWWNPSPSPDR